jgi:RNA polymerase sigma factor (sigma-70 family)
MTHSERAQVCANRANQDGKIFERALAQFGTILYSWVQGGKRGNCMLNRQQKVIFPHLCRLIGTHLGEELSDGQLLERFVGQRDGGAFAALVRRHGRTVLGVCRRVLNNDHDAEDAFQATFLVLVRRARSIAKREAVGSWLYGVACRVALKARIEAGQRRHQERRAAGLVREEATAGGTWDDVRPIIDEEVNRLPEKYRRPIVLCYFEGKTYEEVARLLGWPAGTASTRLARARALLRGRLTRRGLALSSGALAAGLAQAPVSSAEVCLLAESTVYAALRLGIQPGAAGISSQVVALTEGVVRTMLRRKMKTMAGVLLAVSMTFGGAGLVYRHGLGGPVSAADPSWQAADSGDGALSGDLLIAAADGPGPAREPAQTLGPATFELAGPPQAPTGPPPRMIAPSAQGARPLHSRIGLINITRALKASREFQSLQADLGARTKEAQRDLESLKEQVRKEVDAVDPATPAARREQDGTRLRQLQRQFQDEQNRVQARLEQSHRAGTVKMYREVEDAANRIAKLKGLELVMFYTDAVTEADFYSASNLQRKLTQPGALMPMIVAPGIDITEAVIEALNH